MHEHNALSYGVQLSRAAARAAGLGEGESGLGRLGETLTPTLDLWSRPEWRLLRGEIRFMRRVVSVAVAARFSSIELVNASTVLAVIDVVRSETGSGTYLGQLDTGPAIAANPLTTRGTPSDSRAAQLGETSGLAIVTGDVAAGVATAQWNWQSNTQLEAPPWVIAPGAKLFLIGAAALTQITALLSWYERSPFPGELKGG